MHVIASVSRYFGDSIDGRRLAWQTNAAMRLSAPPQGRFHGADAARVWPLPAATIALAAALSLGCKEKEAPRGPPPPVAVQTIKVQPQPLSRTLEAIGSLRSDENTVVASEIGGKVVFLDVPEGRVVKKGHVLARLDASTTAAELRVAQARVEGAKTTMERSALLAREQLIAGQQLDEAQIAAKTARGELARTAASLDKSVIRAPFAGTVGLREVSVGAFVSPGTAITHITNTKAIKLVFSVPEGNIPDVAIGQTAYGVVGSCRYKFTGRVTVLDPMVDPVTRSIRVQASVANEEGELKPGMSARIRLELTKIPNALVIPEEAVIREGTMSRVFVVQGGKAVPRPIVVGEIRTGMVEIQSGLKPGDVVITTGHQKVRPGARVIPQPHESVKNPNLDLGKADAGVECWF